MSYSWAVSLFLLAVFLLAFLLVKKEIAQSKDLNSQFECGFLAMNPSHLPFSFQFFLVSLLFLIFDIEIALVISYPQEPHSFKKSVMMFVFLAILTVGLLYEWQKSKLNWSK